jgi:hypothetical protein
VTMSVTARSKSTDPNVVGMVDAPYSLTRL